jgi:hypothetical protein
VVPPSARSEVRGIRSLSEEPPNLGLRRGSPRVPQLNRGSGQWARSISEEDIDDVNLLHLHSVTDRVAVSQYIPGARRFFEYAQASGRACGTCDELDLSLSRFLAVCCYVRREAYERGVQAVYGVIYLRPELQGRCPLSRRALQSWRKLQVAGEGSPTPWPGVCVIARQMRDSGEEEAADVTLLAADSYLRESDWALLHPWDVVWTQEFGVSLRLGDSSLGETTKTGPEQGVRPDRPWVELMLLRRKRLALREGRHRLFRITPSAYYKVWRKVCDILNYLPGPPHSLRHTGASYDALEDADSKHAYRSLEEIRLRGRWRVMSSVARYSKTFVYNSSLAAMPPALHAEGARLYLLLGQRQVVPKR